ncbi:MAG: cbb3-type cytochrome c oxidase subunit I [Magnetococcales bacterium]|nr:cbb3-type cytochrome c oxidase subunit I [Magnetococcales bacterium]
MSENTFSLAIPPNEDAPAIRGWLLLALGSLVGAGLVVILIILARMPVIHDLIPWTGSFRTALVVHVDLSVLVWFLSFAGFLSAMTLRPEVRRTAHATVAAATAGALLITFSPFLGQDMPYLNNYVPVLANTAFLAGLGLFASGFYGMAFLSLTRRRPAETPGEQSLLFGLSTSLIIAFLALLLLAWSYLLLPERLLTEDGPHYFELLFWGPGHLLQFTYTQLEIIAWFWLASTLNQKQTISGNGLKFLFVLGAIPTLGGPVFTALFDIQSPDFRLAMTQLMAYGNGLAAIPAALILLFTLTRRGGNTEPTASRPERLALLFSLVLFGLGGMIGVLIQGVNVTIPAHYHGSIVSITLAFMGLTYHLLPRLGGKPISSLWASRQLILYSFGSMLHVLGLAWSGSHGIQRKTAGAAQGLETLAEKIPMWIMGFGGIVAVIGGIVFLILAFGAFRRRTEET